MIAIFNSGTLINTFHEYANILDITMPLQPYIFSHNGKVNVASFLIDEQFITATKLLDFPKIILSKDNSRYGLGF